MKIYIIVPQDEAEIKLEAFRNYDDALDYADRNDKELIRLEVHEGQLA